MTAEIDGFPSALGISVLQSLCEENFNIQKKPHRFHGEYLDFLKSVDVKKIIDHYHFTEPQVHAIALFLMYYLTKETAYQFFEI